MPKRLITRWRSSTPTTRRPTPSCWTATPSSSPALAPASAFTVSGPGIHNPAEYALLTPTVSLATALGKAGGLEDRAELDKVRITRTGPGGHVTVILLNAVSPAVLAAFQVQPGDDIVIGQAKRKSRADLPIFRPTPKGPDVP